ncbi:MAG: cytochrome c [Acidobacteriota bacterium]
MKICYRMLLLLAALAMSLMIALGKGDVTEGKTVFSQCVMCHGDSGQGNEAIGKALGVKIPDLGSKEVQALDDSDLKKVLLEGKGKMQAVNLSDAEVDDVIAFIRSLNPDNS